MYNTAIPKVIGVPTHDNEKLLADLKLCGANRVFLALPALPYDAEKRQEIFDNLKKDIEFFKGKGVEIGVWFWAFWVQGENPFTPIKGFGLKDSVNERCPLDPAFMEYATDNIKKISAMDPDLIMFDDDLRFGHFDSGYGCICEHHRKLMSEILGEELEAEGLFERCFTGGKNKYRSAYLKAAGDSLKSFCKSMRDAIDEVNPRVRLGACSCISVWDGDGVDSYELAKIMAGSTKPFVRLIGAPYWGSRKCWGHRIENVVEFERLERAWCKYDDIEIFSEGDPYPRPCSFVPAAYLEIFDSALRFSGGFDGILKYMLDYTSKNEYERGYINRHLEHQDIYKDIDRITEGKKSVGVRVYDEMNKLEDADFTGMKPTPEYVQDMVFTIGGRFLSEISVPTIYEGAGEAGLAFGENARHLPKKAFEKPLILDLRAAKILGDMGIDTGIEAMGEKIAPDTERFPDGEYVSLFPTTRSAYVLTLKDGAKVISEFKNGEEFVPSAYTYTNVDGANFLVFNFIADESAEKMRRCYRRARQLHAFVEECGEKLPVKTFDNSDLYIICKKDEKSMAIGFWDCFEDYCRNTEIELDEEYKDAEFIGCTGTLCGNKLVIDKINAFEFCFVNLTK